MFWGFCLDRLQRNIWVFEYHRKKYIAFSLVSLTMKHFLLIKYKKNFPLTSLIRRWNFKCCIITDLIQHYDSTFIREKCSHLGLKLWIFHSLLKKEHILFFFSMHPVRAIGLFFITVLNNIWYTYAFTMCQCHMSCNQNPPTNFIFIWSQGYKIVKSLTFPSFGEVGLQFYH